MPSTATVAEVLERALDLIHENGWYQGDYSYGARLCSTGALCAATGRLRMTKYGNWQWDWAGGDTTYEVRDGAVRALARALPPEWRNMGVAQFNDSAHTRLEDIENLFKEAINSEK